ncbi:DUF3910 family protein [Ectobacillus ponti]|uniref:DUF3910 family protein n=1 Tax=Ectobacillus ponti TaxID=2961894 RepID=A0AA42BRU2_9BACI|nr:DUF3910 family protein [Ectobacillus ponti]MCP8967708.1 DUF3910 family protein [Ectobacillus ponti]
MNLQETPDWIGTPRVPGETQFMVDFTLPHDDGRYKLIADGHQLEIKAYEVKPGAPKPSLRGTSFVPGESLPPAISAIFADPYVRAVLAQRNYKGLF